MEFTKEMMAKFRKLKTDLPYFAKFCLKIKTKNSEIAPLNLNNTQVLTHNFIEDSIRQKRNKIVILKARQFGISTYTEARLFHKTLFNRATNSFIMSESGTSSNNIFEMTKRFYDYLPEGMPKPALKKSNEKAIVFDEIDSSFRIGTAGNKQIGRSMTINNLHCSEVGFWDNANEIIAGLFQTVPDKGEIILESTANGVGNYFHDICLEGFNPKSKYNTLFIPWFANPEYRASLEQEFKLTEEEEELKALYKISDQAIQWRRNKINNEFKNREHLFKQEYPANFNEAFITTQNSLIPHEAIEQARKSKLIVNDSFPVVIGIDPARDGGDRTAIAIRQGRRLHKIILFDVMTETELAGIIIQLINYYKPKKVFMDPAHGYGTYDILKEKHLNDIVSIVNFGSGATNKIQHCNKRTEIHSNMRDWFMQDGGVRIPDIDQIAIELASIPDFKLNSNGQFVMIPKEEIKKQLNGKSPDIVDAIALTFSEPVPIVETGFNRLAKIKVINNGRR